MAQANQTNIEQDKIKRWLASAIEQSSKTELWSRRELKSEWRRAAGNRARLA